MSKFIIFFFLVISLLSTNVVIAEEEKSTWKLPLKEIEEKFDKNKDNRLNGYDWENFTDEEKHFILEKFYKILEKELEINPNKQKREKSIEYFINQLDKYYSESFKLLYITIIEHKNTNIWNAFIMYLKD